MPKQKMHWCTGKINLSGQNFTIINLDATNMISWPEAQVLMRMHGEENVYDLKPAGISEVSVLDEKERLQLKYSWAPVESVFPGRNPRMETLMPGEAEDLLLPPVNHYGEITGKAPELVASNGGNGDGPDDDEDEGDDPAIDPAEPPAPGPAIFKPGKHPRPAKGA